MAKRPKPIVLTVLDGWGYRAETKGNAIALARKPNYDRLLKDFPNTLIHTSGPYVGLPEGQMGNSEVGHLNIGAGRIVQMDITRVDQLIASGEFFQPAAAARSDGARPRAPTASDRACSATAACTRTSSIYSRCCAWPSRTKSRMFSSTASWTGATLRPTAASTFSAPAPAENARIRCGANRQRQRPLLRDGSRQSLGARRESVIAPWCMAIPKRNSTDPVAAVRASYEKGVTDEFIIPGHHHHAKPHLASPPHRAELIRDDDAVIFFNFRADRARQITMALDQPASTSLPIPRGPKNLAYVAMTQYDKTWPWLRYILAPEKLEHILANVFAEREFKNLRVAETEKYAHVTYFFNGGVEKPFPGEERTLVPSPKVPTYDLKPEMSAAGIADTVIHAIEKGDFDAIIMNFANADMVGHSGKLEPTIKAVETVDECLGRIFQCLRPRGGAWIITADHGNAETMIDPVTGGPHTYHTTNPVPFIVLTEDDKLRLKPNGSLRDVAPTLLGILGLAEPGEMTGHDLRELQK